MISVMLIYVTLFAQCRQAIIFTANKMSRESNVTEYNTYYYLCIVISALIIIINILMFMFMFMFMFMLHNSVNCLLLQNCIDTLCLCLEQAKTLTKHDKIIIIILLCTVSQILYNRQKVLR